MGGYFTPPILLVKFLLTFGLLDVTFCLRNIALLKPASQSSTYTPSQAQGWETPLGAFRAVDGYPQTCDNQYYRTNVGNDGKFSHTMEGFDYTRQWWKVDLQKVYYIYRITLCNRGSFNWRLNSIYILSNINEDPTSPNRVSDSQWIDRSFRGSAYDNFAHVTFLGNIPSFPARHIAVYNSGRNGVTLREVQIYGFSQDDIDKLIVRVSNVVNSTTVILRIRIEGFDAEIFESAQISIAAATGDGSNYRQLGSETIYAAGDHVYSDGGLFFSTQYRYQVVIISHGVPIYNQEHRVTTDDEVCVAPDKITPRVDDVAQWIGGNDTNKWIGISIDWPEPETGCTIHTQRPRYTVSINGGNFTFLFAGKPLGVQSWTAAISNLQPHSTYNMIIRVTNKQNKYSDSHFVVRTQEAGPGDAPGGIALETYNTSCLVLSWTSPPTKPNGVIRSYEINCVDTATERITFQHSVSGTVHSYSSNICDQPSGSRINCSISARTVEKGVAAWVDAVTKYDFKLQDVDPSPPARGESGFFEVLLPTVDTGAIDGEIKGYSVIVSEESTSSRTKRQTEKKCKRSIDRSKAGPPIFDPLLEYDEAKDCGLDYYLAARLDRRVPQGYRFPVGDGKNYNGVMNVELEEGSRYSVYYGVNVTLKGETIVVVQILDKSLGTFTASRRPTQSPPENEGNDLSVNGQMGTIIAVVVSVVCVIVAVTVVTILLLRKRRQLRKTDESSTVRFSAEDNEYTTPTAPSVSARPRSTLRESNETNGGTTKKQRSKKYRNIKGDYENCPSLPSSTEREESEAIPIDKLKWYIESNQEVILEQYEKLADVPVGETLAAFLPENKSKCRYKSLYPVDEFRVILKRLPSQGTDFINASYMPGYENDRKFIAAQGPTNVTIEDFWLMIWQQEITSIVMATRTFETNKMKCMQYWPETKEESQTIGDFHITNIGVERWPDYSITQLKVVKGSEEKWLTHFQFLSWPDHDVPDMSQPFLSFYRKFTSQGSATSSPILVHCSAGVGRSGAIIALDYLLGQAKAESKVDFYKCVVAMRERRPNMIQTQEQYLFVHRVLYDALSTEGFLTQIDMLPGKRGNQIALTKEFEYIEETLSKVPIIADSGGLPEHRAFNRYPDVLPDDKYRIYLSSRDGQTYINAVRVNGYHKIDQFYATQVPLEETIKDLWQLVHERSCRVIVQLGDADDNVTYHPTRVGTGYSYGNGTHTVTNKSYSERGPLQIFQLEHAIEKKNILKEPRIYSETSEITLIKLPQNLCTRTNIQPMHMISMVEQLVRIIEKSGDINVLVVSRDGAALCGMFICAFNCLESIRLTQEVEVYSQVLLARYRRRQFLSNFDEYKHIYQILEAYVDQFSQYQNVSCI